MTALVALPSKLWAALESNVQEAGTTRASWCSKSRQLDNRFLPHVTSGPLQLELGGWNYTLATRFENYPEESRIAAVRKDSVASRAAAGLLAPAAGLQCHLQVPGVFRWLLTHFRDCRWWARQALGLRGF